MGLFGSSGTRGVVNRELTPTVVERLAAVAVTHWDATAVAIGRDTRHAGPVFANAASAGAASAGADVYRLGILPTPGLQSYVAQAGIPGMMITASHNPPAYTGVKLFDEQGIEMGAAALEPIEAAFAAEVRDRAAWDDTGTEHHVEGAARAYIDEILERIDREPIAAKQPTIAIDPGHGAAYETSPQLCRELGCRVVTVHDTPDGRFAGRQPEPVPEALDDCCRLVRASEAMLGVAHDGDGDRSVFIDETGTVVPGDTVLAILASEIVEPDDVVVIGVNASDRVAEAVKSAGGRVVRTPIGSAHIVERVQTLRDSGESVTLAGEANGGIFLPTHRLARDGAFVLAKMIGYCLERPLGERAREHTGYYIERRQIPCQNEAERKAMLAAIEELASTHTGTIDRTDGIRFETADGWTLVRPSGTEPIVRVVAEAREPETARDRVSALANTLEAARTTHDLD